MSDPPETTLDARFSSEGATATPWRVAEELLGAADLFWIVTVRRDGRPHVTPLVALWLDGALWFCTGPTEQKAKNLAADPRCTLLTGCNTRAPGHDVVVEGTAQRVVDDARLHAVADAFLAKYGEEWRFLVTDGGFVHAPRSVREDDAGVAHVFQVVPRTAFGFGRGTTYSQTRWRFGGG